MNTFDVVIIGGGPAGCATALSLYKNTVRASCLVIDDANPLSFKIGESLPPESGQLLHYLHPSLPNQISSRMGSETYTSCTGNASAWSSSVLEERHAILNPFGHGLHLDRADFDEVLRNVVVSCTSESKSRFLFEKGRFKGIHRNEKSLWNIEMEMDDKGVRKRFVAKWVVDATGRKASVASKLGKKIMSPGPLLAFYAVFVSPESDSDDTPGTSDNDMRTLIEAAPNGWWYTSLISHSPKTRIVVFHTLPSHPAAKSSRRSEGFLECLHDSTDHISSIVSTWDYAIQRGYPHCTAAGSSHLEKTCDAAENWVAVGDAAMAFDPLSSQGIMTALEMGIYIGLKLSQHVENQGTDVDFDQSVRDSYTQVRRDYEKHRMYYYSIVKRFPGEMFWENIVDT